MRVQRSAVGITLVVTAVVVAGALVARVGIGGAAATPAPTLKLSVAPKPKVAPGENVLGVLSFSYPVNASPTTLTGAYVLVTMTPALSSNTDFKSTPLSSSFCSLQSLSIVRCNLGNVRKGDIRTMFVVVSALGGSSISMAGAAFWNENLNGKNPQPNNMVNSTPTSDSTSVVLGTDVNANGKCTVGGSTLATGVQLGNGNQVATDVSYPSNAQGFPCTPVSLQDDITITLTNNTCTVSGCDGALVTLPQLPSPAIVTITFDGSLFPPPGSPPNPNTFIVYEVVGSSPEAAVPFCSSQTTTLFGTCEVGAVKFGTRGIRVTLQVQPTSGLDPGYVG